jgi:tetratricopeptide (TPR) repeat protein
MSPRALVVPASGGLSGSDSGRRTCVGSRQRSDRKTYGDDHPEVAADRNNLASLLRQLGDLPAARVLFEQALASDRKTYGDDHPTVAIRRHNLALLLRDLGDLPAARVLLEQALATFVVTYGDDHPKVAQVRRNLAALNEPPPPAPP